MFASAWSIAIRLLRLPALPRFPTLPASTVVRPACRGGTSGGAGAVDVLPTDLSFPVRKRFTACRVRWTCARRFRKKPNVTQEDCYGAFRSGSGVLRISTAHSIRVLGSWSRGINGSWVAESESAPADKESFSKFGGGGSANAEEHTMNCKVGLESTVCIHSETGRSSTTSQSGPPSGVSTHTSFTP